MTMKTDTSKLQGYLAVVLEDGVTKAILRGLCKHPIQYCEHITLAFKPTQEVFDKYASMIDKLVDFDLVEIVCDDRAQAAVVFGLGLECENPIAHVTMSCAPGTKPFYSNELLKQQAGRGQPLNIKGNGRVTFIQF